MIECVKRILMAWVTRSGMSQFGGAIVKTTEMHDKIEKHLSAGLTYDYSTSHD